MKMRAEYNSVRRRGYDATIDTGLHLWVNGLLGMVVVSCTVVLTFTLAG